MKIPSPSTYQDCRSVALCASALVALVACSDDAVILPPSEPPPVTTSDPDPEPPAEGPVYALETVVFTDEGENTYVSLSRTPEFSDLDLSEAREFSGWIGTQTIAGGILVSDTGTPSVTRYEIDEDLEWEEGPTLSFANQGAPWFGFSETYLMDEHTAYFSPADIARHIVWDPTELVIREVVEDSLLAADDEEGRTLSPAFQRIPWYSRGPVMRPFYYVDPTGTDYAPTTSIVVYDAESHQEERVLEAPCPGLEYSSPDEDGNVYYSTWNINPGAALFGVGPAPCVSKVLADRTLDPSWDPARLLEWTDGRYVRVLHYMKEGKAIGAVLHHEAIDVDFDAGFDQDVYDSIETDQYWRLWLFDLEAETARPIEGIAAVQGWFNAANIDGRTFALLTYDSVSGTRGYEIDVDGNATLHFESIGWVYNLSRVR